MKTQSDTLSAAVKAALTQLTSTRDGLPIAAGLASYRIEATQRARIVIDPQKRVLYVKPDWFASQNAPKQAYALAHEDMHAELGHGLWLKGKALDPSRLEDAKIAADLAVFSILAESAIDGWRSDLECCKPEDFGLPRGLTVDQYFSALEAQRKAKEQEPDKQEDGDQGDGEDEDHGEQSDGGGSEESDEGDEVQGEGDGGDESEGVSGDDGDAGGDDSGSSAGDGDADSPDGAAGDGSGDAADGEGVDGGTGTGEDGLSEERLCGDIILPDDSAPADGNSVMPQGSMMDALASAGFGSGLFDQIMQARERARIDWRKIVRRFMEQTVGRTEISFQRPARKHLWRDAILPGQRKTQSMESVVVFLDTSGSINDAAVMEALWLISSLCVQCGGPGLTCHVIQFSGKMEHHDVYTAKDFPIKEAEIHGRGGTVLGSSMQYMRDQRINPKLILIITDGMIGDLGRLVKPTAPVLWCINGAYHRVDVPFGTKVPIY